MPLTAAAADAPGPLAPRAPLPVPDHHRSPDPDRDRADVARGEGGDRAPRSRDRCPQRSGGGKPRRRGRAGPGRRIDDFSAAGLNAVEAGGIADGDCRSGVGSDRNDGRGNGGHRRRSRHGPPSRRAGAATVQRLASNPAVTPAPGPPTGAAHGLADIAADVRGRARRLRRPAGWSRCRLDSGHGPYRCGALEPMGSIPLARRCSCAARLPCWPCSWLAIVATARRNELGRGRHLAGARRPGPHRLEESAGSRPPALAARLPSAQSNSGHDGASVAGHRCRQRARRVEAGGHQAADIAPEPEAPGGPAGPWVTPPGRVTR